MAAGGGAKRRYQYCTDVSGIIVYLRALQGHSGSNLIDPLLQDNVKIQSDFFHYIYHIGCAWPGGWGRQGRRTTDRARMERCSPRGAPQKPDGDEPVRSPKNTSVNLHSIIINGLIPGRQNSSKRQTVFFLPVNPMDKSHKDPEKIDLSVPRRAQYLHNAWKKHQDAFFLGRC